MRVALVRTLDGIDRVELGELPDPEPSAGQAPVRVRGAGIGHTYPVRVCLNGNEWLKQQLRKEAIPFDSLDNGFLWCADPDRLEAIGRLTQPS